MTKSNILYIQTDQHRPDIIGAYGNHIVKTPQLDQLAAQGIRFNNAFCCTGVCTPSRGAVLSGQWPHRSGMVFNPEMRASFGHRLCDFDGPITAFSEVLSKQGYALSNSGKWHIGPRNNKRGESAFYGISGKHFEGYGYPADSKDYLKYLKKHGYDGFKTFEPKGGGIYNDGKKPKGAGYAGAVGGGYISEHRVSPEASIPGYLCSDTIRQLKQYKKTGKNFFHSINFWGPHIPVNIPPEYLYMYNPDDMPLSDNNRNIDDNRAAIHEIIHRMWGGIHLDEYTQKRIIAAYYGYVSLIDDQLARVFEYLDKSGLHENTTIIFTADHGSTLGAHGLQDKGVNVYDEVYRIPLIIAGAQVKKPGVVDSFISNLDLTPSFVDLANGKIPKSYDGSSLRPYLNGSFKHKLRNEIIGEGFGHQIPYPQRFIRDHQYKYIYNAVDHDEFYDVQRDPHEQLNIIDSIDPKILKKYRQKLIDWASDTNDRQGLFLKQTKMRVDDKLQIS